MKKYIFLLTLVLSSFEFMHSQVPSPSDDLNWVSSIRYDFGGQTIAKSVNYFNTLGKSTQSQSWDITTQKIWNSETRYDYHGRAALQTLSAPIGNSFRYQPNFIRKSNNGTYTLSDFEANPLNPTAIGTASNTLGAYYSTSNSTEPYQDITSYPFSRTVFSKLNPGAVKAVVGGNKTDTNNDGVINHRDTWLQTYSFSMPAPGQAAGVTKTVSRDVHGIEVVVFTDAEGNTSKAARSGDEEGTKQKTTVNSLINELGYVDIHIPTGCRGLTINNPTSRQLTVYNLITELPVSSYGLSNLSPGFYRIAVNNNKTYIYDSSQQISVTHQVNYYDFTTNTYDRAGRLLRSTQPNGTDLLSQFKYNSLGQLLETTSPDEGKAQFKYRKDGQIRYSQNSKQKGAKPILESNFNTDIESWGWQPNGNTTTSLENGRMKVNVRTAYQGVKHQLNGLKTTAGQALKINIVFDKGTTQSNVRLYLQENTLSGNLVDSNVLDGNLQTGTHQYSHSMTTTGNTLQLRIDKANTFLSDATVFYLDFVSLSPETGTSEEYSYTNYDPLGRPIESGVAIGAFSNLDPDLEAIPSSTKKEQHFTLYDLPDRAGFDAKFGVPNRYKQTFVAGNVSKTWTKNPDTNTTWYSYDVNGRVVWLAQYIEGLGAKTIHYEYDYARGHVTKVQYQKDNANERFIHRYTYNDAGQLTQVETSKDNNSYTLQATYEYYETGALKRTELANGIQGTDYVYNLNGQLKSINHPALSAAKDPGQDANDLFGMQIDYHAFDYARTQRSNISTATVGTNQYNGNIKNTRWNTSGSLPTPREHVYSYTYNKNNWLAGANFSATDNTPSPFPPDITSTAITNAGQTLNLKATNSITLKPGFHAKTGSIFSAKIVEAPLVIPEGDYDVSNITYDANGNIQTLNRNGYTGGGSNAMDNFTYNYKPKTNQLTTVTDTNDNPDADRYNDLKSQGSNATSNYTYNSIGQLVSNTQDQISYEYNAAGLVSKINTFSATPTNSWISIYKNDHSSYTIQDPTDWTFSGSGGPLRPAFSKYSNRYTSSPLGGSGGMGCFELSETYGMSVGLYMNNEIAKRQLSVAPNIVHKLDLDVIINHLTRFTGQVTFPAGAIITIKDANGTILGTAAHNSPNPTATSNVGNTPACAPYLTAHNSFEFTPTTSTITIEVQRDCVGFGRISIDNINLQVPTASKLAFFYDDRGQRVRKEVYSSGNTYLTYYVRDASGSPMGIYTGAFGPTIRQPTVLKEQPIYGSSRLGVHYRQTNSDVYQLTDHLGNVRAVIMKNGENAVSLTAKTDYYPFRDAHA